VRFAWGTSYLDHADWGADVSGNFINWVLTSQQWWGLAVVVVAAFTGALTPATAIADRVTPRRSARKARKEESVRTSGRGQHSPAEVERS
jgi:hypothetical protein